MAGKAASLALYRKYRPATFAEVKGQDHVTGPLRQALLAGRVHHAYLFSGPRGCGKTSSARILARSLNCEQGPTPDPCGKCESCLALAPGGPGSIDVIEIDAASHGGVDDARDLRERAFFAPVSGRFKVYIIDEAHMVTREGFNALLKLVEEPPPHLKFVFATTEPEKVIGTIRSRTHHYPFRLVAPQVLRELLEQILDAEAVVYEPAVLPLVIRAGAGSARDALSVLDQLLAGSDESGITYAAAVSLLGYTDAALLDETVEALAAGDGGAVFRIVDQVINAGNDPRRFAADLLDRLRDLIVLGAVGDADRSGLLDGPADQLARMREQVAKFGTAELTRAAEVLNAGLTQMRGAASPRLLLELTCARMLLPTAVSDEAALLTRLERMERRLALGVTVQGGQDPAAPGPAASAAPQASLGNPVRSGAPGTAGGPGSGTTQSSAAIPQTSRPGPAGSDTTAAPTSAEPAAEPAAPVGRCEPAEVTGPAADAAGILDTAVLRRDWDGVLDAVRKVRKVSWIQLSNASVVSVEGNVLTLEFPRDGELKGFSASGSDAVLARVLHQRFGVDWRIRAVPAGRGRFETSGLMPGGSAQVTAQVPAQTAQTAGGRRQPGREVPGGTASGQRPPVAGSRDRPGGCAGGPDLPRAMQPDLDDPHVEVALDDPEAGGPGADRPRGRGPQPGCPLAGDAGDDAGLTGMELIRRELGGQVIGEVDSSLE